MSITRIKITEEDLTTSNSSTEESEVVYVPGFATTGEYRVPTLCTSLADFHNKFGTTAPVYYLSIPEEPDAPGEEPATPTLVGGLIPQPDSSNTYRYPQGTEDPAYIQDIGYYTNAESYGYSQLALVKRTEGLLFATKALLDEQSTTSLTVGDIAEVTVDESDSNKNNFYKWGTSWVKVGEVATITQQYNSALTSFDIWKPAYLNYISEHTIWSTKKANHDAWVEVNEEALAKVEWPIRSTVEPLHDGFPTVAIPGYGDNDQTSHLIWKPSGTKDSGYIFAEMLLANGMQVVFEKMNATTDDMTVENAYKQFTVGDVDAGKPAIYGSNSYIMDKGSYNIKYITSGGWPTYEYNDGALANSMTYVASQRGECVALIDHTDNPSRVLTGDNSVYYNVTQVTKVTNGKYGAMYTPWGIYSTQQGNVHMPASFGYLLCVSQLLNSNGIYLPVAGPSRGLIPYIQSLNTDEVLSNKIAEYYQTDIANTTDDVNDDYGISINPITYIRPYGYCIWGNRTLYEYTANTRGFAVNFMNIRNAISSIKKAVFSACQLYMFEQNSDVLWINFKNRISPLLDILQSSNIISRYKIVKDVSNANKVKLKAIIKIYPIYAVEAFDINIQMLDDNNEVTVEEV